jgi:RHS repeat-associated protein
MATYEVKNQKLYLQEQVIYGSSRLGIRRQALPINVPGQGLTNTIDWQNIRAVTLTEDSTIRGSKQYELSNHLGNVLATISDRRMQTSSPPTDGSSGITADLISATDYYPFGMEMPGRKFSSDKYKFGFNGKLKDDEVYGEGNFQDYGFRMYDTRVCRFISVDPLTKKYPELTPFQFASNTPIKAIDLDGLETAYMVLPSDMDTKSRMEVIHGMNEGYAKATPYIVATVVAVVAAPILIEAAPYLASWTLTTMEAASQTAAAVNTAYYAAGTAYGTVSTGVIGAIDSHVGFQVTLGLGYGALKGFNLIDIPNNREFDIDNNVIANVSDATEFSIETLKGMTEYAKDNSQAIGATSGNIQTSANVQTGVTNGTTNSIPPPGCGAASGNTQTGTTAGTYGATGASSAPTKKTSTNNKPSISPKASENKSYNSSTNGLLKWK